MAPIEPASNRSPPDEVFAYVTDPSRFVEWQTSVVSGHMEDGEATRVGAKCMTTRRIGFAERERPNSPVDPPRAWGVRGIDGPIRAFVDVTVEPLDGTAVPRDDRARLRRPRDRQAARAARVRRQARKEMPANIQRLKERLEASCGTATG